MLNPLNKKEKTIDHGTSVNGQARRDNGFRSRVEPLQGPNEDPDDKQVADPF
jgi:hypothetical protein